MQLLKWTKYKLKSQYSETNFVQCDVSSKKELNKPNNLRAPKPAMEAYMKNFKE